MITSTKEQLETLLQSLKNLGRPVRVLFVCLGNE